MSFRGTNRGNSNFNINLEAGVRRALIILVVVIVVLGVATVFLTPHFYFFIRVNPDEVGVQLSGGRIKDVVSTWHIFGFWSVRQYGYLFNPGISILSRRLRKC